ncbi:MAG: biotin transporter BioY [Waddliaceae bacterium]
MSSTATFIERERESSFSFALQVILGSLLLALAAQVSIPLPFSPVPITLQSFAVMLIGGFLGREKGVLSIMLYLVQVGIGLPVLAGGVASVLALLGLKGGFLFGFLIQTYIASIAREHSANTKMMFFFLILSELATMSLGTIWLGAYIGFTKAFLVGFLPFIPGECLKILAVAGLIKCKA